MPPIASTAPSIAVPAAAPPPNPLGYVFPAFLLRPVPVPLPIPHPPRTGRVQTFVIDEPATDPAHRFDTLDLSIDKAGALDEVHGYAAGPVQPWLAVRTRSARELAVADALGALSPVDEVYCPLYRASWVVRGRVYERDVPYLATWVFARFPPSAALWHEVHGLTGVVGILGGATPSPIRPREIAALRAKIGDPSTPIAAAATWVPELGSEVRVTDGPFFTYRGTVDAVDPPFVAVKIFGLLSRDAVLSLPINWCEPVNNDHAISGSERETTRRRNRARRGKSRGRFHRSN